VRVLIVDTYYPAFVNAYYAARPSLVALPYGEQMESLLAARFGTADAYSHHLRALGHEAVEVIANIEPLQRAWARERGRARVAAGLARLAPARLGGKARRAGLRSVLTAQVEQFDPDVVYLQDMGYHSTAEVRALKAGGRRLVAGQIASPAPRDDHLRAFDLIVTSFPHFAARFAKLGVDTQYLPLAYDARLHDILAADGIDPRPDGERPYNVSFVGGLNPRVHAAGTALFEEIARRTEMDFWGYGADALVPGSPIRERHHGEAWGLDMYRVLARSRIVVNRHIDAAEGHANNMRLYEATGCGALLLTDPGHNLAELFQPGVEVVAYEDARDLAGKIAYHLDRDEERRRVAAAGQARTLRDHTYARRMTELEEILEARLAARRR
jgi:spore maturation protein CgeB